MSTSDDLAPLDLVVDKSILHENYSIPAVKTEMIRSETQKPLKLCISKFTALEEDSSSPPKKLKFMPANLNLPQAPLAGVNYRISQRYSFLIKRSHEYFKKIVLEFVGAYEVTAFFFIILAILVNHPRELRKRLTIQFTIFTIRTMIRSSWMKVHLLDFPNGRMVLRR